MWCFRGVAIVAIPLLLLSTTEGLLRLVGFGYPTAFFLEREVNGHASLIDNQEFGCRFFPPGLVRYPRPVVLPAVKPNSVTRIFVLGESAAMGDPEPRFGLSRMLGVLLQEGFPQRRFEVVNAAMVAINSHAILPIARECARRQGDLWVIYMGNNEMIGPYGCISKFGAQAPPRAVIRASLAAKTTRVGQAIDTVLYWLRSGRQTPREWTGMSLWEDQQIRPGAPAAARVYEHFEANLRAILEAGRRAGVSIILCPVATNLRDCAPFKSLHSASLTPGDLRDWEAAYHQGCALENQGAFAEAGASYARALALDPQFAELCFRAGRCSLALGRTNEARQFLVEARDRDALPFRADSRLNEIIRRCALSYPGRLHLLDTEELLAAASPDGLTGREFFYEHVHLNPRGTFLLARAVAEHAAEVLGLGSSATAWLGEAACLEALGFTDWNRHQILEIIRERMEQPPFTRQVGHDEQLANLRQELQQLRPSTKPIQLQRAAQQASQAVARRPSDWELRWNLAELWETAGDAAAAEAEWRTAIRLVPHAHLPYYNLGRLLERHGRTGDALDLYRQCLLAKPDFFEARWALGSLLCREGRPVEALRYLRPAVGQRPDSSEAHLALGVALQQANRTLEAAQEFREVLRLDPNNVPAQRFLGSAAPASPKVPFKVMDAQPE